MTENERTEKIALSPAEAADVLGLSLPIVRELTHRPDFPSFNVGRRILIPRAALIEWANQMGREGAVL